MPWVIGTILVVTVISISILTYVGDNEATGQLKQLEIELADAKHKINKLEAENRSLVEETRRQGERLVAATGKVLNLEEQQRLRDNRKSALERLERQLNEREETIVQRELKANALEKDFYEKTNMTMTDIGEAIGKEYENMRAEKDAAIQKGNTAIQKAEKWFMFFWVATIAFVASGFGIGILLYQSNSRKAAQVRESADRRIIADLLKATTTSQLPPDHAAVIVDAFNQLARMEDQRQTPKPIPESAT